MLWNKLSLFFIILSIVNGSGMTPSIDIVGVYSIILMLSDRSGWMKYVSII